jgi:hypothetical protein
MDLRRRTRVDSSSTMMDAFGIGEMEDVPKIDPDQNVQFESPTHTTILLCGLNNLRNKNLLVDVKLVAGGQVFEVCKKIKDSEIFVVESKIY